MKDRHGLRADLRRIVAFVSCAAGGLAGLWLGMLAAPAKPADPAFLPALAELIVPVAWRVGAGVASGVLLAAAVCAAVPWLRPGRVVAAPAGQPRGLRSRRRRRTLPDQAEAARSST